ncbi:MAG TPA: VOC family protein [Polyangia bacterium]|nr:VOC family protein [Polyangia bacterium]
MQKISPFLWFNNEAEAAAKFYVSVFKKGSNKDTKIIKIARYGDAGPGPKGSVMTVAFRLAGMELTALNGGPHFKFTPAISLVVSCATQKEIDTLWQKLSSVPAAEQCGWLVDKYGLSWQIVPAFIGEVMASKDAAKANRVMAALLPMKKLDLATLKQAAAVAISRRSSERRRRADRL